MKTIEIMKTGNHEVFGDYEIASGTIDISKDGAFSKKITIELEVYKLNDEVESFIEDLKELLEV